RRPSLRASFCLPGGAVTPLVNLTSVSGFLSASRASTITRAFPSRTSVVKLRNVPFSVVRSDQSTVCSQNGPCIGHFAQSRSQLFSLPSASLVNATDLPRPYCQ